MAKDNDDNNEKINKVDARCRVQHSSDRAEQYYHLSQKPARFSYAYNIGRYVQLLPVTADMLQMSASVLIYFTR